MRRTSAVAVVLVTLSILSLLGCAKSNESTSDTTRETVSVSGYVDPWLVINGDGIRMAVPQDWDGGDPSDPAVAAAAERALGRDLVASLVEAIGDEGDFVLLAWLRSAGRVIYDVKAVRGPWPASVSMEQIVTATTGRPGLGVEIESVTADRAYVVVSYDSDETVSGSQLYHMVFIRDGSYLYIVFYGCDESWTDEAEPTFRTSANTIVIE